MMRDRETGSIWQQATGEALAGPLRGSRLDVLPAEEGRWAAWRNEHPDTQVAVEPPEMAGGLCAFLRKRLVAALLRSVTRRVAAPGLLPPDGRLRSHEEVAGISLAGTARAYPFTALRQSPLLLDEAAGIPLVLRYDPSGDRVRAFRRQVSGQPITLSLQGGNFIEAGGGRSWDPAGRPLSGTSEPLEAVPVVREWWLGWSEFHPDTSVYE